VLIVSVLDIDVVQETGQSRSKWDSQLTTRKMRRTNLILSYVNEQKVVEGFFALQKYLLAEEAKEGSNSATRRSVSFDETSQRRSPS